MKKMAFLSVLIITIALISFTSCQKDGIFNPKEKISKISEETNFKEKTLKSTWVWDKNLLTKIEYSNKTYDRFEYDKKRLSKIVSSNGATMTFSYDGSKFDKVEHLYTLVSGAASLSTRTVMQFSYKGSKIDKIVTTVTATITLPDDFFKSDISEKIEGSLTSLQLFLPAEVCKSIAKFQVENISSAKGTTSSEGETVTIVFTWAGDNIEKLVYEQTKKTETTIYTYDDQQNPFYGLYMSDNLSFSKNNPTKITYSDSDKNSDEIYYKYKYNGKFPIECTVTQKSKGTDFTTEFIEYQ